jgi:hypothetical protein
MYIYVCMVTVRTNICLKSARGIGQVHSAKQAARRARGMPRQNRKNDAWIQWMANDYIHTYIH